jgi:hypothetical protein
MSALELAVSRGSLLLQTAAVGYMVGLILTMRILRYPLFDRVGPDNFAV